MINIIYKQPSGITARKQLSSEVGYCNGCTTKSTYVTEFSLRGWSGRLCDQCKNELIRKLGLADEHNT